MRLFRPGSLRFVARRYIILPILLIALLSLTLCCQSFDNRRAQEKIDWISYLVGVEALGSRGTGTPIRWRDTHYIITSAHIFPELDILASFAIVEWQGHIESSEVIHLDRGRDLALIRTPESFINDDIEYFRFPLIVGNQYKPETVYHLGRTQFERLGVTIGGDVSYVKVFDYEWIRTTVRVSPGSSGGPFFTRFNWNKDEPPVFFLLGLVARSEFGVWSSGPSILTITDFLYQYDLLTEESIKDSKP